MSRGLKATLRTGEVVDVRQQNPGYILAKDGRRFSTAQVALVWGGSR